MNFLSLDLEMNQPSKKIIEVGAAVGNIYTGEVLETFSKFIKIDEPLSARIIDLTHITDAMLSTGTTLKEAYSELSTLHKKYTCYRNPFTWGGGDSETLRKQLGLDDEMFLFGRRWIDIKSVFQVWKLSQGMTMQGGLANSLIKIGLKFNGTKHRAVDDAKNTFLMAYELVRKFRENK